VDNTPAGSPTRGNIYITFQADPDGAGPDRSDVFFTRSTDGGITWSTPVSVNAGAAVTANPDTTTNDNWQPSIAVSPGSGDILVTFYDRRNDTTSADGDAPNNKITLFRAISRDAGLTWSDEQVSDTVFTPSTGYAAHIKSTYMGDYNYAVADASTFHMIWGDTRNLCTPPPAALNPCSAAGRPDQDVFYAREAIISDLSITKADSPDPVMPGQNIIYNLTVTNNGSSNTTGVMVSDTLPVGVTFDAGTSTPGCTDVGGVVTCTVANLANGANASITITVKVDPATTCGSTLTNMATVQSNVSDPNLGDNTANTDTMVTCPADLSITKSDAPDPLAAGGTLTYSLTVTNNGPGDATAVTVTDTLPAGVTFDSATSTPGCAEAGGIVTCIVGNLANSASTTITIIVKVDPATPAGTITNTAAVAGQENDPNMVDNTATTDTTITPPATLCTILDDFNRADGPLGSNWAGRTSGYRIRSNQVAVRRGRPIYWQPEAYGPDQEACVTLTRINPKSRQHALLLKVQELNNWRKGAIMVSYNARSGNVEVKARDVVNHKWILVGSFTPPTPVGDGDQLRAKAFADGTVDVLINDTSIGTADAGGFYAGKGGQIGLWFRGRQADDDEDDSDHDRSIHAKEHDDDEGDDSASGRPALLDDFGGGTIAAP
jgi:uncharacterized repeat protein (TIGR01451 family)